MIVNMYINSNFCYIPTYPFSFTFGYVFNNILCGLIRHAFNKAT